MLFMRVFIQILAHKDKVYFAPYIRNIKVHNSYYVPFGKIAVGSTPLDIGNTVINALKLANGIDMQRDAIRDAIEEQLQIKTWPGVVKKCFHAEITQYDQSNTIEINRAYGEKSGIFTEAMHKASLDDPEDIGKKVLEALYYYKK